MAGGVGDDHAKASLRLEIAEVVATDLRRCLHAARNRPIADRERVLGQQRELDPSRLLQLIRLAPEIGARLNATPLQRESAGEDAKPGERFESMERSRLPEVREQREREARARLVPHADVVARGDAKDVVARREVRVGGAARGAGVHPLLVPALEFVSKAHTLGRGKAEGRVMELEPLPAGRDPSFRTRVDPRSVGEEFLDRDRRRHGVLRDVPGVDHHDALLGPEPQPPISGPAGPLIATERFAEATHSV
jgi:hypothetical protein